MPAAGQLPRARLVDRGHLQGGQVGVRGGAPRLVRRLPRPRHPHGDDAQRRRRDGRGAAADRGQRAVPAAADVRAPRRRRDHEAQAHHHPAEQDRPGQGGRRAVAARRHPRLRQGHRRRLGADHPDLGAAQVQRRRRRGCARGRRGARSRSARPHRPPAACPVSPASAPAQSTSPRRSRSRCATLRCSRP